MSRPAYLLNAARSITRRASRVAALRQLSSYLTCVPLAAPPSIFSKTIQIVCSFSDRPRSSFAFQFSGALLDRLLH